ncbi:MAG: hypothetical protein M1834_000579 [Cirrosporium novae-zelandiae]|nr:MAG: hypothetical protein M1834_000579 [Cirrosporium novae-zelandiae]
MSAIGISPSDIILVGQFAAKVITSLKETGSSKTKYQHAICSCEGLQNVLLELQKLEFLSEDPHFLPQLHSGAVEIHGIISNFLDNIKQNKNSLGTDSPAGWRHGVVSKAKWALKASKDLETLHSRLVLQLDTLKLHLLTGTLCVTSDNRERTKRIEQGVKRIEKHLTGITYHQTPGLPSLETVRSTDSSQQLFPNARFLIYLIFYSFSLHGRHGIPLFCVLLFEYYLERPLSPSLDGRIRFINAPGELQMVPFEVYENIEMFETFLRLDFRTKPGAQKVANGHYLITSGKFEGQIINQNNWSAIVQLGCTLVMSMCVSTIVIRFSKFKIILRGTIERLEHVDIYIPQLHHRYLFFPHGPRIVECKNEYNSEFNADSSRSVKYRLDVVRRDVLVEVEEDIDANLYKYANFVDTSDLARRQLAWLLETLVRLKHELGQSLATTTI